VTYRENHKDTETQRHRGALIKLLIARSVPLCLCVFVVPNIRYVSAISCTKEIT
jgi:hypothetical protein